jgi:ADP-ribosylglycohydrolase
MTTTATDQQLDRALGALYGVAVGDALGMPSQTLTRAEIVDAYGRIEGFVAPFPDHPVSHGLTAAMITDDTEQTLLLARLLIEGHGELDEKGWANALLDWEAGVRARGLRDLLGPSSKAALEALLHGVPASECGKTGTTNGASMRIAPIGILCASANSTDLLDKVVEVCRVTHATREAISAAAAVAMMISQGIDGADFIKALPAAIAVAQRGSQMGAPVGVNDMAARLSRAIEAAERGGEAALLAETGNSVASHEAVPAAFGILRLTEGDPWQAALIAANFGDDTDTIGAIACAMAGACAGVSAFPGDRIAEVTAANHLDLEPLAHALLALRQSRDADHKGGHA